MPKYSPDTKRAANSGQEAAEWTRSICGAMGIEGSHYYLYAAVFFDLLARVSGRIAEDPPRKDFGTSTHVRPRFATPKYLETENRPERLAVETAEAADTAEAYLAAHLRAFERLQGAQKAGDGAAAAEREAEAVRLARASGGALRRLSALVGELPRGPVGEPEDSQHGGRRGRPHLDDIDREAMAILFLGGLRIRDLEKVLRGTRMEDSRLAVERLPAAAATFREFGETMETWNPPRESEPHLG